MENKNKLFIVGSARGVNRFYIVSQLITKYPDAKIINTSQLIKSIIKDIDLPELDNITLLSYFKYVEPMLTKSILDHLEHNDVILDTTYYYLLPGISAREILKFSGKLKSVELILVSDSIENIIATNKENWFKNPKNVRDDLLLNEYSFKSYVSLFSKFTNVLNNEINLNKINEDNLVKINE